MNIHLLRSREFSKEKYLNVVGLLQNTDGPLKFLTDQSESFFESDEIEEQNFNKKKFKYKVHYSISKSSLVKEPSIENWPPAFPEKVNIVSWDSMFKRCNSYRQLHSLKTSDACVLLTNLANEKNWFSGIDPIWKTNFFVHTDQWEYFLPCDPRFPIAYEVLANILQFSMFGNYGELTENIHHSPCGCLNDFCKEKKEVTLKLRTADICPDCQKILFAKHIDQRLINQVTRTFESIRMQMLFRERFRTIQKPSSLSIKGPQKRIFFVDLDNIELKLTPLEKTLFLLFLKHEDGLSLKSLHEHRNEIKEIYMQVGNPKTVPEFNNRIDQLIDPTENSVSEKLSKIRSKVIALVGEELAPYYCIDGQRAERKTIRLDRGLVTFDEEWRGAKA